MMKKLLVLLMTLVLTLGLVACGGDTTADSDITPSSGDANAVETIDIVEVTGNGLSFILPADIQHAKTDENSGTMFFTNDEKTVVITLPALFEAPATSADITDDVLSATLSAESGLNNGNLESSCTIEHDSGISVVGFGKGTLLDGTAMNSALQFFFPADGSGYYCISYLYVVDAGTSLEDTIDQVVSSVETIN